MREYETGERTVYNTYEDQIQIGDPDARGGGNSEAIRFKPLKNTSKREKGRGDQEAQRVFYNSHQLKHRSESPEFSSQGALLTCYEEQNM